MIFVYTFVIVSSIKGTITSSSHTTFTCCKMINKSSLYLLLKFPLRQSADAVCFAALTVATKWHFGSVHFLLWQIIHQTIFPWSVSEAWVLPFLSQYNHLFDLYTVNHTHRTHNYSIHVTPHTGPLISLLGFLVLSFRALSSHHSLSCWKLRPRPWRWRRLSLWTGKPMRQS